MNGLDHCRWNFPDVMTSTTIVHRSCTLLLPWLPAKHSANRFQENAAQQCVFIVFSTYSIVCGTVQYCIQYSIELPYSTVLPTVQYCIAYSIHVARFWLVWGEKVVGHILLVPQGRIGVGRVCVGKGGGCGGKGPGQ